MGGKVKQAQRTKNNARPSNSGRSAELLGASVPSFVGFTAHSDLGIVPMVPGFQIAENLPETFDANISSQFQMIFRKMSKKDPVTKSKALQEFCELINESDLDTIKTILPIWPKFYCNLANDVDHKVRDYAQQAQSAIIDKAGKTIAPYLKQLAPVWIASQFDNYAPAASLSLTTFRTAFAPHKIQEVYNFCQNEILEYISKNLLYHTASTINNTKLLTPEEAENKYHRLIVCSLKLFSFYLENINENKMKECNDKIKNIVQNQKFWSFAKSKDNTVKSAWFELLYTFLQTYPNFLELNKQQTIQIVFQNIDDTNPIIISHVWGCVLLIQATYEDWYTYLNFKKAIQPKLFSLIKSKGSGCATIFYPNLFPFISKLSNETLHQQNSSSSSSSPSSTIKQFYIDLFDNIKQSIMNLNHTDNKSEIQAIIMSFYECIRYIIQKQNTNTTENQYDMNLCELLIESYVIKIIEWCIINDTVATKQLYLHISKLIAYLTQNSEQSLLYSKLLKQFWLQLNEIIMNTSRINDDNSMRLQKCLELIQNLYNAYENHNTNNGTGNRVKFLSLSEKEPNEETKEITNTNNTTHNSPSSFSSNQKSNSKVIPNIIKELRVIAVQLAKMYIEKISKEKTTKFVTELKSLIKMFDNDANFYLEITNSNDLKSVFNIVSDFLNTNDYSPCEAMLDIAFEILLLLDKNDRMDNIEKLLKVENSTIQQWIINRLLSYPLCIEPEIRKILSQDHVSEIILNFAKDFIKENSKDKFNLLHKCFFQIDSGEILIDQNTIEGIVKIMSEPITKKYYEKNQHEKKSIEILDTCGSFIAQIMPVICSICCVSKELQRDIFLKLFKFSIDCIGIDNDNDNETCLSEDTLWEIITCWQDALSSNDIKIDKILQNECSKIIKSRLIKNYDSNEISINDIINIADLTAKLIICSLESIQDENERLKILDELLYNLLDNNKNDDEETEEIKYNELCKNIEIICSHSELIDGIYTIKYPKEDNHIKDIHTSDMKYYFRRKFYNFIVIFKLICNIKSEEEKLLRKMLMARRSEIENDEDSDDDDDREFTEDYIDPDEHILKSWSNLVYDNFILSLKAASLGESLMINSYLINEEIENLILNLSEKINLTLQNLPELFLSTLKDKIFNEINANDISSVRILNFLCILKNYSDNEENGPVLLIEDAGNCVLDKNDLNAYLNIVQIMLKKIPSRSLPINYDILDENNDILIRMGYLKCLITNHFSGDINEISDRKIISFCLIIIQEIDIRKNNDKTLLLYNVDINKQDIEHVFMVNEFINLLKEILDRFPTQLDIKCWDIIRIGLSSWVLSISKSIDEWYNPKVSIFISSIYKLYLTLSKFIGEEKTKSSTEELTNIIDEWENVFALEVNLILFKSYVHLVTCESDSHTVRTALLDSITPTIEFFDYSIIFNASQNTFKYKTDDIIKFCLENLSNKIHSVRITSMYIIQKLTQYLISIDIENLEKRNDITERTNKEANNSDDWHLIHKFIPFIKKYETQIEEYLLDFNYKLTDLLNFREINRDNTLTYLYLWDCIIFIFSKSPSELRSFYASTLTENKFEQILLNFLFRCMPIEILKNHDIKTMNNDVFKTISWNQFKDRNVSVEKLACHTYTQMLRYLPAVVRKWWNATNARQKTFIDKLTTNFVSNLICNEELRSIAKQEKHENMQITVHTSTREVIAVYSIDEVRMELIITLAPNHPLGCMKVESIKQIGSRAHSRNLGMQLTIFLTHQNGSLFDGLLIWKKNLDKKFEGVEECYICYTVIHQDTCQLPKLLCKTCKKKFHGPCLYKWFTTSRKSTCPLCRNVF